MSNSIHFISRSQIQARADRFGDDRNQGIADLLSEKQPSKRLSVPSDIKKKGGGLRSGYAVTRLIMTLEYQSQSMLGGLRSSPKSNGF